MNHRRFSVSRWLGIVLKEFIQLQNINRDKLYEDDPQHFDKPDALKKDFVQGA